MNWKVKAHLLAALSRIPAGSWIYHSLQRVAGTNRLQLDRDLKRAFELVQLVQESERSVEGARVLEVGTGWRPLVPFVFSLAGAEQVHTIDVNPWLTHAYAIETWTALQPRLEEIAAEVNCPIADVEQRYHSVDAHAQSLPKFLEQLNITYCYPGDARSTGLESESVDLIVSSNVLEHIPLDLQTDIHKESHRILKSDGISAHRFNPQDHYSTVDSSITHANFLSMSAEEWNWYGGSGLAYHNRLRSRDYREMFEQAGFALPVCRERIDQRSLAAIQSGTLVVHDEFSKYTPEELSVDYMWVVAEKQSAKPPVTALSQETASAEPATREQRHEPTVG
ncbi:class I SAM-dependent methyltransferase [Thalassoglobus polymorphus]|nr:class I SAM-dependent methyltransferase [Thalassoglobus polymorphus]